MLILADEKDVQDIGGLFKFYLSVRSFCTSFIAIIWTFFFDSIVEEDINLEGVANFDEKDHTSKLHEVDDMKKL